MFTAAHMACVKILFPGLLILAWVIQNAKASLHQLLRNSPSLRISRKTLTEFGHAMHAYEQLAVGPIAYYPNTPTCIAVYV